MNGREKQIFELLCKYGDLSVEELGREMDLSPSSIRRYLAEMPDHRFIRRTRGGATLSNLVSYTPLPIHKPPVAQEEARAIAHCALEMIERGDVIGLSGGRICTELALHMRLMEGVTVVTNAVNIAAELVGLPGIQVVMTGGTLDPRSFELTGKGSQRTLEGMHLNKYFVGADGITVEHGMTNHSEAVAVAARDFVRHADRTILLADSSKFKRSNLAQVATVSELAALITTDRAPLTELARLRGAGLKCIVARCSGANPAPARARRNHARVG